MTENIQIPSLSWAAFLRANIHSVTFVGIYSTKDDLTHDGHIIKPYPEHRDTAASPSYVTINPSTIKVINVVKQLDKKNISIVDFGGGNGKMYNALKQKKQKKNLITKLLNCLKSITIQMKKYLITLPAAR